MSDPNSLGRIQAVFRILLGLFMLGAGVAHLLNPAEFWAQVPKWLPADPLFVNLVVWVSGIVEIAMGLALIFWKSQRERLGLALAVFFVLIFPGNLSQYMHGIDAFGLDTDTKRLVRLFFQPVLIVWALWSTGAWAWIRARIAR